LAQRLQFTRRMSRTKNLVAGRLATYLLAAAALPLVACMDVADADTGTADEGIAHGNQHSTYDPDRNTHAERSPEPAVQPRFHDSNGNANVHERSPDTDDGAPAGASGVTVSTDIGGHAFEIARQPRNQDEEQAEGPLPLHIAKNKLDGNIYAGDRPSSADRPVGKIGDAGFAHEILAADVKCTGKTAHIMVQLATPSGEVEIRMQPQFKVGEFGRWYQARESYLLEGLMPAPHATSFAYWAQVALDGSCEDFKAQLDQVRVTYDHEIETLDLQKPSHD
jgi:hypothetical protein